MKSLSTIAIAALMGSWLAVPVLGYNKQLQQETLNRERAKWQAQGITDYDYKHERFDAPANDAFPFTTQVRHGGVVSYKDGNNQDITWYKPATMDSYFNLIQDQINLNAQYIDVTYNPTRGFPEQFYIVMNNGQIYHARNFDFYIHRGGGYDPQQVQAELNGQRAKWQAQGLMNYDYKYERFDAPSNDAFPFTTQVRNGGVVSYKDGNNQDITWYKPATLDSWFNLIQDQLNLNAPFIEIIYNPYWGFPEMIHIIMNQGQLYHVRIFDFVPIIQRRLRGVGV